MKFSIEVRSCVPARGDLFSGNVEIRPEDRSEPDVFCFRLLPPLGDEEHFGFILTQNGALFFQGSGPPDRARMFELEESQEAKDRRALAKLVYKMIEPSMRVAGGGVAQLVAYRNNLSWAEKIARSNQTDNQLLASKIRELVSDSPSHQSNLSFNTDVEDADTHAYFRAMGYTS